MFLVFFQDFIISKKYARTLLTQHKFGYQNMWLIGNSGWVPKQLLIYELFKFYIPSMKQIYIKNMQKHVFIKKNVLNVSSDLSFVKAVCNTVCINHWEEIWYKRAL